MKRWSLKEAVKRCSVIADKLRTEGRSKEAESYDEAVEIGKQLLREQRDSKGKR